MASNRIDVTAKARKRTTVQPPSAVDDKIILRDLGYTLLRKIGHGSFAKVWRAKAQQFKKEVAVKIIAKQKASKEYVEKFLPRELSIIQKLKHPNIIKFYEITEARQSVYIVMQLAERGTIAELIENKKYFSEETARIYFSQLMDVVEFCHRNGIVHRDIKCENLLLDRNYKLLLTDFGFAKQDVFMLPDGRVRRSRTYCGSYAYASPEVLANVPYDPFLSDVWCMGMVLYTMVIGFLPYKQTDVKMLINAKKKPPKFPESPEVSVKSKTFIKRMLTIETERSYIKELRKDPWLTSSLEKEEVVNSTTESKPSSSNFSSEQKTVYLFKPSTSLSFSSDEKHDKGVATSIKSVHKGVKVTTSSSLDSSASEVIVLKSRLE